MNPVAELPTSVEVRNVIARRRRELSVLRRLLSLAEYRETEAVEPSVMNVPQLLLSTVAAVKCGDTADARRLLGELHGQHGIPLQLACDLESEVTQ